MKFLKLFLLLVAVQLQAQSNLTFNKYYVECEDKWIAFQMNKDSSYTYGFIYIDEQAGLTFNLEGTFKIGSNKLYQIEKSKETNIKARLQPNNVKVAIIPTSMYQDLQIDSIPEWLKYYKENINSIERLYKWGYMYNGWNQCEKALAYLLKANEINPSYKGLAVEIAYSYNCLKDYNNALLILENAIIKEPQDSYINKEFIYTLIRLNRIDKAIEQYQKSLVLKINDEYNAENCFNILVYYYNQNDKENFDIWKQEIKKWRNENEQIKNYIKQMENQFE